MGWPICKDCEYRKLYEHPRWINGADYFCCMRQGVSNPAKERLCVKDLKYTDERGLTLDLRRGKEYITMINKEDGYLRVFTSVWALVPKEYFVD